jgi:hypothetical protein
MLANPKHAAAPKRTRDQELAGIAFMYAPPGYPENMAEVLEMAELLERGAASRPSSPAKFLADATAGERRGVGWLVQAIVIVLGIMAFTDTTWAAIAFQAGYVVVAISKPPGGGRNGTPLASIKKNGCRDGAGNTKMEAMPTVRGPCRFLHQC